MFMESIPPPIFYLAYITEERGARGGGGGGIRHIRCS